MLTQKLANRLSSTLWYHATTFASYLNIKNHGIRADYNKGHQLDFGYGFYLTSSDKLAESYIRRLYTQSFLEAAAAEDFPVIMQFEFCPCDWFTSELYHCKIFDSFDDEFAEFVFFNRTTNVNGDHQHSYDAIYGVMSDSVPTRLVMEYHAGERSKADVLSALKKSNSMKQISLHSQALCDTIQLKRAYSFNPLNDTRKELDDI